MVDQKLLFIYNSIMKSGAVDLAFIRCCFYATSKTVKYSG